MLYYKLYNILKDIYVEVCRKLKYLYTQKRKKTPD